MTRLPCHSYISERPSTPAFSVLVVADAQSAGKGRYNETYAEDEARHEAEADQGVTGREGDGERHSYMMLGCCITGEEEDCNERDMVAATVILYTSPFNVPFATKGGNSKLSSRR